MPQERDRRIDEAVAAVRRCRRVARLYRILQLGVVLLVILGGGVMVTSASEEAPPWQLLAGLLVLAAAGVVQFLVHPAERAAAREAEARGHLAAVLLNGKASADTASPAKEPPGK